jgi:hypothetical protein
MQNIISFSTTENQNYDEHHSIHSEETNKKRQTIVIADEDVSQLKCLKLQLPLSFDNFNCKHISKKNGSKFSY